MPNWHDPISILKWKASREPNGAASGPKRRTEAVMLAHGFMVGKRSFARTFHAGS
jgi:hypothetical protein